MTNTFIEWIRFRPGRRWIVNGVAAGLVLWIALSLGFAQLKNQRRVTSVRSGVAAEGSRVSVVADSPLNDYEAFRRGDRFYVRIAAASFSSVRPQVRGNGFEDLQVGKAGESVLISFRLQPGASARVDQGAKRLDVIISTAARNRVASTESNEASNQSGTKRIKDDATKPTPPIAKTATPTRESEEARLAAGERGQATNDNQLARSTATPNPSSQSSPNNSQESNPSAPANITQTQSPAPSAPQPVSSGQGNVAAASEGSDSSRRLRTWATSHWVSILIGGLAFLGLILLLWLLKRKREAKTRPSVEPGRKAPVAVPTIDPKPVAVHAHESSTSSLAAVAATPGLKQAGYQVLTWALADNQNLSDEDQEREVFEL